MFIDSLGSQAAVMDRSLQQRRLEQLSMGITAPRDTAGLPSVDGYCSTATFTDNMVIGFPIDKTGDPPLSDVDLTWAVYLRVLLAAASYQAELVRHRLFVRGGIATGPLWMDTNFVYGSGLIDAYKLEHEHAIYPRIIVSSQFVDIGKTLVGQLRSAESEAWLDNFLIHGRDGQYFINYLFDDRIQQAQRNDVVVAKTGYTGRRPPASMNWKSKTQSTATCLSTLTAAGSVSRKPKSVRAPPADQKFPTSHARKIRSRSSAVRMAGQSSTASGISRRGSRPERQRHLDLSATTRWSL